MNRFYYVCKDLDEIAQTEEKLLAAGFSPLQLHVLSENDAAVAKRNLHDVASFSKRDVFRASFLGAGFGVVGAALVLLLGWLAGASGEAAWTAIGFLALCILGFCTWEGGLFGIQEPNREFKRFAPELKAGRHVFFADVNGEQKEHFLQILSHRPGMVKAGTGGAEAGWWFNMRESARRFIRQAP